MDENFSYYGASLKNPIFREEEVNKNQYIRGNCLKRVGLDSLQIEEGAWQKRGGGVFEEEE